jgi:hypothetical protein
MVRKILLIIVLLPLLLWMLAPKKELFYLLEKQLATQGIVLSDGIMHEQLFGLTIEHPTLYFKGIKVATAHEISLWSVLVYTQGSIDAIAVDSSLQSYLPKKIEKVSMVHSVVAPKDVIVSIIDPVLAGDGNVAITQRKIHLLFPKLPPPSALTRYLKQTKGGWTYEQRF